MTAPSKLSAAQIAALRAAANDGNPWQAARTVYVEEARRASRRLGTTSRSASTTIGALLRYGFLADDAEGYWAITKAGRDALALAER